MKRTILHVVTGPLEDWVKEMMACQEREPELEVKIFDAVRDNADYHELLKEIFSAESVQVW